MARRQAELSFCRAQKSLNLQWTTKVLGMVSLCCLVGLANLTARTYSTYTTRSYVCMYVCRLILWYTSYWFAASKGIQTQSRRRRQQRRRRRWLRTIPSSMQRATESAGWRANELSQTESKLPCGRFISSNPVHTWKWLFVSLLFGYHFFLNFKDLFHRKLVTHFQLNSIDNFITRVSASWVIWTRALLLVFFSSLVYWGHLLWQNFYLSTGIPFLNCVCVCWFVYWLVCCTWGSATFLFIVYYVVFFLKLWFAFFFTKNTSRNWRAREQKNLSIFKLNVSWSLEECVEKQRGKNDPSEAKSKLNPKRQQAKPNRTARVLTLDWRAQVTFTIP